MLRKFGIIAVLSLLAVAFAAVPALATGTATFNPAAAPQGTSLQQQSVAPTCSFVGDTQNITCTSYELTGVGNANATATLTATYSATIDCRNNGGNVVATKTGTFSATSTTGTLSPENGRLFVPTQTVSAPTEAQFLAMQTCPNPNWTPEVQEGTEITLVSSRYTLTFAGFTSPYITIVDP